MLLFSQCLVQPYGHQEISKVILDECKSDVNECKISAK